jgi:hypothetical protein
MPENTQLDSNFARSFHKLQAIVELKQEVFQKLAVKIKLIIFNRLG